MNYITRPSFPFRRRYVAALLQDGHRAFYRVFPQAMTIQRCELQPAVAVCSSDYA